MTQTIHIDAALVRRLIAAQFPDWADLAVTEAQPQGHDHRTFRLGPRMSVRLPSAERYAVQAEKEARWLPRLAPRLPVAVPEVLASGRATDAFPWLWSVRRWIDGSPVTATMPPDRVALAEDLARFLRALHAIPAADGPLAGMHNFDRGGPLSTYDLEMRGLVDRLGDSGDAAAVLDLWTRALATTWQHAPVWVHGDIAADNLLIRDGRLAAVIDFGSSGVGDPACDLAIGWTLFAGESRAAFRLALPLDADTWSRGQAWALWKALLTLGDDPADDRAAATVAAVLSDGDGA